MLKYSNRIQARATANNQQSFSVAAPVTLSSIDIRFFSNNNCNGENNGLKETVTLNGGDGVIFDTGTYTSTGASNYALCGKYSTGCAGLYAEFESNQIQSMRFDYNYAGSSGGPGVINSVCMSGSADSLYKEAILNWSNGSSPWTACSDGNNCGFSQAYTVNLPTTYSAVPTVIVTPLANWQTMMGSSYAFTAAITGGSSIVTPAVTGLTGNTISPSSCSLNSAVAGSESCVFIITAYTGSGNYSYWNPAGESNSMNVNSPSIIETYTGINLSVIADSDATINGSASPLAINNIGGTVIVPYVYLQAPMEGIATESNTGITWGTDGTVNTRFIVGSEIESDCVTDNLTGLMWAKNATIGFNNGSGGVLAQPDYANTDPALNQLTWSNTKTAITRMNSASNKLCGYADWRMPTIKEMMTLINYSQTRYQFSLWLQEQGFVNVGMNAGYWSSTEWSSGEDIWTINFINAAAGTTTDDGSTEDYLWPVRNVQ